METMASNDTIKKLSLNRTKDFREPARRIITLVYPLGRLGNHMFSYASFIGIAQSRDMEPQLFGSNCKKLTEYFDVDVVCNNNLSTIPGKLQTIQRSPSCHL